MDPLVKMRNVFVQLVSATACPNIEFMSPDTARPQDGTEISVSRGTIC